VPGQVADELRTPATHQYRPYLSICVMNKMITALGLTGINLKEDMIDLFADNYTARRCMAETGFPQDWAADPFWN
jgi:hypothetical protein